MNSVALHKMKKILNQLSSKTGKGTELISLYIPPKKALHDVVSALRDEHGAAANIKSDQTKTNVQGALVKTMQRLKLYNQTPSTGLAIFCGALQANSSGTEILTIHDVIPPKTVGTYLYRCDDHFHLDILNEMLKEEKTIGILSIDASETGIGIVEGSNFDVVNVLTSGIAGKHRAGGQSARRFERLREMEMNGYYHRIADHAYKAFLEEKKVAGVIIGGPGYTKSEFIKTKLLDYRLQKSIITVIDTAYSGAEGARETLDKSEEFLKDIRLMEEKRFVQKFLKAVNSSEALVSYGLKEVKDSLKKGSAEIVLVTDDIDMMHINLKCLKCENNNEVIITSQEFNQRTWDNKPCSKCSKTDYETIEKDLFDHFTDLALNSGTQIEVISSKTEEGSMLKSFSGMAALLRYR